MWLVPAQAFEQISLNTYFPAVTQGHHGTGLGWCGWFGNNSTLTMNNTSKINGTQGARLDFCYSNQGAGMPSDACDTINGSRRLCSINSVTIPGLSVSGGNSFRSSSGIHGGIGFCSSGQSLSLGSATQNQFANISLYSACTLSFSTEQSEYRIQSLAAGNGAKIVLVAGDYWIDSLLLNQGAELEIQGDVRIFAKNTINFNGARVNGGNTGSLLLFGYSDIELNGDSRIDGYVYADQEIKMNGSATINGRTTSRYLSMTTSSAINDQAFTPPLTCFSDTFSSSPLSDDWVVARSSGNFTPSIVGQRLRLTQAVGNQSTSTTYQRLFPAASNLVTIEFNHYAYNGSGADGIAVVLSDAKVTPQPGAFGGPLGYGFKPGISGFAGGWLGIGIDEFGNFSGEGGVANVGQRRQSVVVRGSGVGTSGYNYLRGTCSNGTTSINGNCLNPRVDNNGSANHGYRLTVDSRVVGQSMVKVERNTGSGYVTLIDSFNAMAQAGQAAVPEDFLLSLTGSTGGSTNIHEIDNVQICALRSSPVGVQIDHFQLDHSGQALTCNPETVTIKACADAACSSLITDPVTATLSLAPTSSSNGWVGGNTVTFSGGSTTVQLRNNTASAVTIGVSGSTPTTKPFSTTLCKSGNGTPSVAACTLSFADSGFFFDVPDTYSNQPQTVTIKAVKKSDVTKQCVPGFASQTKNVKFWSSYISPTSNPYNSQMSVNSSAIGASQGAATPLSLAFDDQGQSTMTVKYPDAGKVQLDARYDGTGNEAGLVMLGSDQFVARPVGLCITPPQGVCTAGDSSCPVFKKAGETFQVDIKAMAWESANDGDICAGNQTTPNFVLSGVGLGSTLVAPSPGTNATVGTTTYNHVAATNSLNSVNQTVSEVGVFRMTATPLASNYFGYTIPSAQSQPVGRFIPADFELVSGDIVPACSVFSYMGQPFGVTLDIIARNVAGGQTRNYTGDFAKGNAYITTANSKNGTSLSSRLRSLQPLPWLNGHAAFSGSSEFVRLSDTQPDGPFKALLFGLYMQDNDGERTLIASPDFNEGVVGDCSGSNCNARLIDATSMKAYFGRLLAGTGAGLAAAPLAIPLQMQYYEAGDWLLNEEDQCTLLSLVGAGTSFINPSHTFDAATQDLNLGANRKIRLGLGSTPPGGISAVAKDGEILFNFAEPKISVRIPYKVDLSKQPAQPLWLSDPVSLQGEAIFGSSRGNDRIIYRREVMQ
ncbi:MSHA biogenesis protein MshQ [Aeromonas salmonicida subsp. salmonicida]|nr:MSHA biogenesis protein MshQ [Aeromonas salmonicida subsp. salmonicida]